MPPPAPRPPRAPAGPAPAAAAAPRAPAGAPAQPAPPMAVWQGPLVHRRGGAASELCSLSIQVPASYLDALPAALYVSDLAPRRAVPLGRHAVCRCALPPGGAPAQLAALGALSRARLVAVAPLARCDVVVVPYLDGAGRVRVVAFLRLHG